MQRIYGGVRKRYSSLAVQLSLHFVSSGPVKPIYHSYLQHLPCCSTSFKAIQFWQTLPLLDTLKRSTYWFLEQPGFLLLPECLHPEESVNGVLLTPAQWSFTCCAHMALPSPWISITDGVASPAHNVFMNAAWGGEASALCTDTHFRGCIFITILLLSSLFFSHNGDTVGMKHLH